MKNEIFVIVWKSNFSNTSGVVPNYEFITKEEAQIMIDEWRKTSSKSIEYSIEKRTK